jgi:hypothetical protein
MHIALKLSFHEAKLSLPASFWMDRRLLLEDDESDDDMVRTGTRGMTGEGQRETADCKSVERDERCMGGWMKRKRREHRCTTTTDHATHVPCIHQPLKGLCTQLHGSDEK